MTMTAAEVGFVRRFGVEDREDARRSNRHPKQERPNPQPLPQRAELKEHHECDKKEQVADEAGVALPVHPLTSSSA